MLRTGTSMAGLPGCDNTQLIFLLISHMTYDISQTSHLLHAAHWHINGGPLALDHIKLYAQRWQGSEDVTEKDDTVGLERTPGL